MAVLGIGGLFFRSRDPAALKTWYKEMLGIGGGCVADPAVEANEWVWQTLGGPVVFEPFKADSDYFAPEKAYMINLRVDDLDATLAPFRGSGAEVITKPEWDDPTLGRFARVHDPEGNAIELWEQASTQTGA